MLMVGWEIVERGERAKEIAKNATTGEVKTDIQETSQNSSSQPPPPRKRRSHGDKLG